jgi:hypothetical protein
MNSPATKPSPEPALDLNNSSLFQNQVANAIFTLNGSLVRGNLKDAEILYQMFVESVSAIENCKRMTVAIGQNRYIVARDQHHVYIVQTQVS